MELLLCFHTIPILLAPQERLKRFHSEQIDRAMALRDRTIEHFNPLLGENCDGEMDD